MTHIRLSYEPAHHGWLILTVEVNGHTAKIDASDVPNNPVENLLTAVDLASVGVASSVYWSLEPDGYFMYFTPVGHEVHFKLDYAARSVASRGELVFETQGSPMQILLPFWRFIRDFQSRDFQEPHWPVTDYARIETVKANIMKGSTDV